MNHPTRIFLIAAVSALLGACEAPPSSAWQGYVEGETLYIGAPLAGTLETVPVQSGDQIAANATLFALQAAPDDAALAAAQAQADAAAAEVADLEKGRRPEEIQVIQAQYAQAKAAAELSAQQLQRTQALVARKLSSQEALDQASASNTSNRRRLDEISAQLQTAQLAARPDQLAAAQAKLRAAQAEVAQVQWRLQQKVQTAPAAGLVQEVLYHPGEFVAAGKPVVALLPPERIKLRFYVPETALAQVHSGSLVSFACDGCGANYLAQVTYVSPEAEYTPPVIYSKENREKFLYLVEAHPQPATAPQLHPGQPVDVRLTQGSANTSPQSGPQS